MNIPFGLAGLLTIIFIVLKLIGVIAWSWIWVLSPLWIALLIHLLILALAALGVKKTIK